jgi:hypothetical protein
MSLGDCVHSHVMVDLCQVQRVLISNPMARCAKRKKPDAVSDAPKSTTATLKEYMWGELMSVIQRHSTISLSHKTTSDMPMKRFR